MRALMVTFHKTEKNFLDDTNPKIYFIKEKKMYHYQNYFRFFKFKKSFKIVSTNFFPFLFATNFFYT